MSAAENGPWTLGEYELHEVVSSDLVSSTYRAARSRGGSDSRRADDVALRVVRTELAPHTRAVKGFLHVNERVAAIDHPHLLRIVDVGTQQGDPLVATVWREGMPLSQLLLESAPLDPRQVLRLGGQLAEALDTVHADGIVHGNVGLQTVWIKHRRGSRMSPGAAVTGFGTTHLLAAILPELDDRAAAVDLLFVAPEQLQGEPAGPRTDQYALAGVVFTALTGTTPFRGETNNALFGAQLYTDPPRATAVRDDLDPGWDEVFARALAKDPNDRYDNCRTLLLAAGRCAPVAGQRHHAAVSRSWEPRTGSPAGQPTADAAPPRADGVRPRRRLLRLSLVVLLVMALAFLGLQFGDGLIPLGHATAAALAAGATP